jgi:hypothetical protein
MSWNTNKHNFIWCSHGGSVALPDVSINVPTGTLIKSISLYVPHNEIFYLGDNVFENVNKTIEVLNDRAAEEIEPSLTGTNTNIASLPPLAFGAWDEDKTCKTYTTNMGLWYYPRQSPGSLLQHPKRILNFNDVVSLTSKYNKITYSIIIKYINDYVKNNIHVISRSDKNIHVHFATCRSTLSDYIDEYNQIDLGASYKHPTITPNMFVNELKDDKYYMFARFHNKNPTLLTDIHNFTPLAGVKHAGCGFNVLTIFKAINQQRAREQAVCLGISGQSIFSLIAYLNQSYNLKSYEYKWTVIRYPILKLINIIQMLLQSQTNNIMPEPIQNTFIIVKLYAGATYNGRDSHSGHTVALYIMYESLENWSVMFLDPQTERYIDLRVGLNALDEYLNEFGATHFDIILREMPSNSEEWNIPITKRNIEEFGGVLIKYNVNRYMGGTNIATTQQPKEKKLTRKELMKFFSVKNGGVRKKRTIRKSLIKKWKPFGKQRKTLKKKRPPLKGKRKMLSGKRKMLSGKRKMLSGKRKMLSGKRKMLSGKRKMSK